MPLHKFIQKLILIGVRLPTDPLPDKPHPPEALKPLIAAVRLSHQAFNSRAVDFGHRYRSAFWAIYLLSATAVLCACLPLALGWDDERNQYNHLSIVWVIAEVLVIMLVGLIFWRGHRQNWQGQWLAARTEAELAWYLPVIAPLIDFDNGAVESNWYSLLFNPDLQKQAEADIKILCNSVMELSRTSLAGVWSDPNFVTAYAQWSVNILQGQRYYHRHVACYQHALLHRVHTINGWLFGLTAVAALSHLMFHSKVLTLMTTFLPALAASLHGALAQSEAYRLESTSLRLVTELDQAIIPIRQTLESADPLAQIESLQAAILSAVSLILDEHQDWHMLVRPHHLHLG
jgi:hydrogenase-4 membrane subunit HyfE